MPSLKRLYNTADKRFHSCLRAYKHLKSYIYRLHTALLRDLVVAADTSFSCYFAVVAISLKWLLNAFIVTTESKPANSHGVARATSLKRAGNDQTEKETNLLSKFLRHLIGVEKKKHLLGYFVPP